jgi:AcrR family transcriptional regulator
MPKRTPSRSASPGKRAANRERNKKAILKAALGLFSTRGFYNTTTRQISRKAGIAEGTLFNYFRTKEDLALYFFEHEIETLIDWYTREKRLRRAGLPEKLFAIIHHHLEWIAPYEEFIGAVYLRALQPVSKLNPLSLDTQQLSLRYLRFIRDILAEAASRKEIPNVGDIGAYVFALFHMAIITYWLHDISPNKENTLALLDRSLKIATNVLRKGGWDW